MGFARSAGVYEGSSWGWRGFRYGGGERSGAVCSRDPSSPRFSLDSRRPLAGEPAAPVPGLEAWGNVDGVLTWHLGRLAPGETNRTTVLIGFADSRDDLIRAVAVAREKSGGEWRVDTAAAGSQVAESPTAMSWLIGASADFALDARGAFNWEGHRQCLTNATARPVEPIWVCASLSGGGEWRGPASGGRSEPVGERASGSVGPFGERDGRPGHARHGGRPAAAGRYMRGWKALSPGCGTRWSTRAARISRTFG